ncbi:DUF4167 domain-containing protein [Humitalea sp. 24SJ18S-53]|uniref:DUF4167 domain-containing protein n=1 Tax=Humitalea sp. 24SJ18S-53 TaxID=3422307 RepID=UPI003D67DC79
MKRMRGRGGNRHGGGGGSGGGGGGGGGAYRHAGQGGGGQQPLNRNHVFDSSGPDMRMRGTAQQLFEKYLQVGRDATGAGDRVMAESYFQHAEHYFRILNAMAQAAAPHASGQHQQAAPQQQGRWRNGPEQPGDQTYQDDQNQPYQPGPDQNPAIQNLGAPEVMAQGNGQAQDGDDQAEARGQG